VYAHLFHMGESMGVGVPDASHTEGDHLAQSLAEHSDSCMFNDGKGCILYFKLWLRCLMGDATPDYLVKM
jgi:hypothetical protein